MDKFGTETRLQQNQVYTAVVKVKGEATKIVFTSKYAPLFGSIRVVRNDFKKLFEVFTDDEIYRTMHENSKLAIQIANPAFDPTSEIPYFVSQYVRYKTELDLLTDIFVTLSTEGGAQEKNLGDLKISKEVKTPKLEELIKLVQSRLAPWESELTGMRARPTSSIRAGANEYPLNGRVF